MFEIPKYIGIDVGGTKIEILVLDDEVNVYFKKRVDTKREQAALKDQLQELILEARNIAPQAQVGIGIPGSVSNASSAWINGNWIKQQLEAYFGETIFVENDANCLGLSEAYCGAAKDYAVCFFVILGTGAGGAVIVNKSIISGRNSITGEWGHNPMPWPTAYELANQAVCSCSRKGCLETYVSGSGFAYHASKLLGEKLSPQQIIKKCEQGDALAKQACTEYKSRLGRCLASVVNLLDPDVFVIGGGLSNWQGLFVDIHSYIQPWVFCKNLSTPIVAASNGDSSGVIGAAFLSKTRG